MLLPLATLLPLNHADCLVNDWLHTQRVSRPGSNSACSDSRSCMVTAGAVDMDPPRLGSRTLIHVLFVRSPPYSGLREHASPAKLPSISQLPSTKGILRKEVAKNARSFGIHPIADCLSKWRM